MVTPDVATELGQQDRSVKAVEEALGGALVVRGERLLDPESLHNHEACAVCETVAVVGSAVEEPPGCLLV